MSSASSISIGSRETRDSSLGGDDLAFEKSIYLKFPKFSKGFKHEHFVEAFGKVIDIDEICELGRLKYPNEWNMTLRTKTAREKLLQMGKIVVRDIKCVIHPVNPAELRGKIHWLPAEIEENRIKDMLSRFGTVLSFEKGDVGAISNEPWEPAIRNITRCFSLKLNNGIDKEEIPHFINVNKCEGLVVIKGRDPICIGCRQHGHKKAMCPKSNRKFGKKGQGDSSKGKKTPKKPAQLTEAVPAAANAAKGVSKSKPKEEVKKKAVVSKATGTPTDRNLPSVSSTASGVSAKSSSQGTAKPTGISDEMKSLHELVITLSQRLGETFNITEESQPAPEASNDETKANKKKKKKKKAKATGSYDLSNSEGTVPETKDVSNIIQPSSSMDSGIVIGGTVPAKGERPVSSETAMSTVSGDVDEVDIAALTNKKKKKKKKKNKSAGGTEQPVEKS